MKNATAIIKSWFKVSRSSDHYCIRCNNKDGSFFSYILLSSTYKQTSSLESFLSVVCFLFFPNCPVFFFFLSQVFCLSSALLTANQLFGVSHRCIFFCSPVPKQNPFHLKEPKRRIHQTCISSHVRPFLWPMPPSSRLPFFFFFFLGVVTQ